jgi:NIMA (never in mitosis gene a)-related kinase
MATTSSLGDFEFLGRLGKGCFGEVHKVRRRVDGLVYVMKQINIADLAPQDQMDAAREAHIMASVESEHVVRYYDSFLDEGMLCIVMEYCDRGDLQRMIKKQNGIQLPEERIWMILIQIMLGLAHLHASRILHRDIKSANVLLCSNNRVKIGDLGVARILGSGSYFAKTVCGSPYYLSPELVQGHPYNSKSDVWSLGCILYELCTFRPAFEASNPGALIMKIIKGEFPPIPDCYSERLQRLVNTLLDRDTARRPTAVELLADDWIYAKAQELGYELPEAATALHAAQESLHREMAAAAETSASGESAGTAPHALHEHGAEHSATASLSATLSPGAADGRLGSELSHELAATIGRAAAGGAGAPAQTSDYSVEPRGSPADGSTSRRGRDDAVDAALQMDAAALRLYDRVSGRSEEAAAAAAGATGGAAGAAGELLPEQSLEVEYVHDTEPEGSSAAASSAAGARGGGAAAGASGGSRVRTFKAAQLAVFGFDTFSKRQASAAPTGSAALPLGAISLLSRSPVQNTGAETIRLPGGTDTTAAPGSSGKALLSPPAPRASVSSVATAVSAVRAGAAPLVRRLRVRRGDPTVGPASAAGGGARKLMPLSEEARAAAAAADMAAARAAAVRSRAGDRPDTAASAAGSGRSSRGAATVASPPPGSSARGSVTRLHAAAPPALGIPTPSRPASTAAGVSHAREVAALPDVPSSSSSSRSGAASRGPRVSTSSGALSADGDLSVAGMGYHQPQRSSSSLLAATPSSAVAPQHRPSLSMLRTVSAAAEALQPGLASTSSSAGAAATAAARPVPALGSSFNAAGSASARACLAASMGSAEVGATRALCSGRQEPEEYDAAAEAEDAYVAALLLQRTAVLDSVLALRQRCVSLLPAHLAEELFADRTDRETASDSDHGRLLHAPSASSEAVSALQAASPEAYLLFYKFEFEAGKLRELDEALQGMGVFVVDSP